jgi:ATP-dependent DNA helicase RecG
MGSEKRLNMMLSQPEGQFIEFMKEMMLSSGLPEPQYEFTSFFTVIFVRRPQVTPQVTPQVVTELTDSEMLLKRAYDGVNEGVNEGVKLRLSKELIKIHARESITRRDIEKLFNVSTATAERDIAMLKDVNLIRFEGAPKTGKYVLTEKGKKMMEEVGYGF